MKNVKLVLSDMDGTLLNSKKELPVNFFNTLTKLHYKGIKFVVASGRGYASLKASFSSFDNDIYYITDNGTIIYYKDECIFNDALDDSALYYIHNRLINTTCRVIYSGIKGSYAFSEDIKYLEHARIYYTTLKEIKSFNDIDDTICKIAIYNEKDAKDEVLPLITDLPSNLSGVYSSYNWVDISNKGVSKGSALLHLQEMLNIKYEETMAFGDFDNDIEMLKNAYYSYAMENSTQTVLDVARFKTLSNDDNGVMIILDKVVD